MYPMNAELKWVDSKKKGFRFYQRTLENSLVLMDIPKDNIFDFQRLMDLERQGKTCERVDVYVDRYCPCSETWTDEWYKGYLRLSSGNWNVSGCTVTIPVVVNDDYTCLTSNWEKDFNIFDYGGDPVEVQPFYGVIQYEDCEDTHVQTWTGWKSDEFVFDAAVSYWGLNKANNCIDEAEGWTIVRDRFIGDIERPRNPKRTLNFMTIRTRWAREFSADVAEPPGGGWIAVTGGWARPVNVTLANTWDTWTQEGYDIIREEFGGGDNFRIGVLNDWRIVGLDQAGNNILNNGRNLNTVIENWLADCDITVVSDFLGINPDGSAPANDYYTQAATDAQGIVLFQVTDVARTDETESAKRGTTTFKKILNALKVAFNIDVEIVDGVLRIEHQSYWQRDVNMDLTEEQFLKWIRERWAYTYDSAKLPKRELYFWGAETDRRGGVFDGFPIEYDNTCVNDTEATVEESYRADGFLTNVGFVVENEDFYDSELILMVSTLGGVVNFAEVTRTVIINLPSLGIYEEVEVTRSYLNGNMGFRKLHENYHDYGRPFRKGFINEVETDLFQTLRQRQQVDITIPMQCSDYLDNFDPTGLVKTQMGAGEIEKATYTDPQGTLTLSLKHK